MKKLGVKWRVQLRMEIIALLVVGLVPALSRERQALMFPHKTMPAQSSVSYSNFSRKLFTKGSENFPWSNINTGQYQWCKKFYQIFSRNFGNEIVLIKSFVRFPITGRWDNYSNGVQRIQNCQFLKTCILDLKSPG